MKKHTLQENYERLFGPIKENWWDKLSDKSKQSYISKHGSAPNVAKDGEEKMDPEKYGYAQTLNNQSELEFQDTVSDYLDKYGDDIPDESKNDIEKWWKELDSGDSDSDREEELEQKIADEIEGLEAADEPKDEPDDKPDDKPSDTVDAYEIMDNPDYVLTVLDDYEDEGMDVDDIKDRVEAMKDLDGEEYEDEAFALADELEDMKKAL
jgi:hypothetical protein